MKQSVWKYLPPFLLAITILNVSTLPPLRVAVSLLEISLAHFPLSEALPFLVITLPNLSFLESHAIRTKVRDLIENLIFDDTAQAASQILDLGETGRYPLSLAENDFEKGNDDGEEGEDSEGGPLVCQKMLPSRLHQALFVQLAHSTLAVTYKSKQVFIHNLKSLHSRPHSSSSLRWLCLVSFLTHSPLWPTSYSRTSNQYARSSSRLWRVATLNPFSPLFSIF